MTAEEIIQLIRDRARKDFKWSLDFPPGSDIGKLYDYSHRALSSMADEIENKLKEEQNMDKLEGDELKKDGGKVPMHLLPISDLEPLARVYEFGAKKYEEGSWRKIEPTQENINRIASALMRHIAEWQEHYQTTGEFATDEESGLPTMAHVMWNAVELMHLERMSNTTLTIDKVGRCNNRQCIKNHCARHWKNNSARVEAKDLNESNAFKCANYLPKYTVARVERLQDISEEDCLKEGIIEDLKGVQYSYPTNIGYCGQYPFDTPKQAFAALIDKVGKKGTWESNPWVFVYDFELVD